MDLGLVVEREHKQALTQIEINPRKVAVVELRVLAGVSEVCQDADDFLAFGSFADFVELVEVDDGVHRAALDDNLDDFTPCASLVSVGVSFEKAAVGRTTKRDECEITAENFADTLLHKRRLAGSHRTLDCDRTSHRTWIRTPLTDHLHNLELPVRWFEKMPQ